MIPNRRTALLVLALAASCAAPGPRRERSVFGIDGAASILRARTGAERDAVLRQVEFLRTRYGYAPDGTHRDLRDLRDLLDREALLAGLRREPVLELGAALVAATGYRLEPAAAPDLVEAATGPPGRALADPAVRSLLSSLRAEGRLSPGAGADLLALTEGRARALVRLASLPDARERIRSFAGPDLPFRFRPGDAAGLLAEAPVAPAESPFFAEILGALALEFRPGRLPELRRLAARPEAARELIALAREAEVTLVGPGALLVLARLADGHRSLDPAERRRFRDLAGRLLWPDTADFLDLVPLSRIEGVPGLVDRLASRYRYRFDAADRDGLAALVGRPLPEPVLPAWIGEDGAPLRRPGLLLSDCPVLAFADENDVAFLDALRRVAPDLAATSRDRLEADLARRIARRSVRYRLGAPYAETPDGLARLLRPDLLKIRLLLDALERPEVLDGLLDLLAEDVADRTGEIGGHVLLGADGRLSFVRHRGTGERIRNDRLLLPVRAREAALEFHFHATDEDDSAFAGPSSGRPGTDLFRAARHGLDGVVLTKIPGRAFDADFYSSTGVVVDLGVYGESPGR